MTLRDNAELLLKKSAQDVLVIEKLSKEASISDETLGFHAQQAVEKALKAVLMVSNIRYPKTHDLIELLQLLDQAGMKRPFKDDEIEFLSPYATALRYEEPSNQPFDRKAGLKLVKEVVGWAEKKLKS